MEFDIRKLESWGQLNVENGKNSFIVLSHAKISCHHYTVS